MKQKQTHFSRVTRWSTMLLGSIPAESSGSSSPSVSATSWALLDRCVFLCAHFLLRSLLSREILKKKTRLEMLTNAK